MNKTQAELDNYIDDLEKRLSAETDEPQFMVLYQQSQILQSQGKLSESLPLLSKAMEGARQMKDSFVWKRMYMSIGMLLAVSQDYLGQIDDAEVCAAINFIHSRDLFLLTIASTHYDTVDI